MKQLIHPPKPAPDDKIAVLSPSFAAPAVAPDVHEQALIRLRDLTGLQPVEFPTTRKLGSSPKERAADINAALADPEIRAIIASIGGSDQITVIPHLDADLLRRDPKPFLGYSDNTNLLNWMWTHGVAGYYGGSTQVHIGPGPHVDPEHLASLTAALLTGEDLEITEPGTSEDFGRPWEDPASLVEFGDRQPTEPWTWAGPRRTVTGRTWGGCIEIIDWLALADRMPSLTDLEGGILLLETSEELPDAEVVAGWVRALGERGVLAAVSGVVVARPPVSALEGPALNTETGARLRAAQREAVLEPMRAYNPDAVVCIGPPFGHTRPQWILPYGGEVTLDGEARTVTGSYR